MSLILWLSLSLSLALAATAALLIVLAYVGSAGIAAGLADWKPSPRTQPVPAGRWQGWDAAHASNFAPSGFAGH